MIEANAGFADCFLGTRQHKLRPHKFGLTSRLGEVGCRHNCRQRDDRGTQTYTKLYDSYCVASCCPIPCITSIRSVHGGASSSASTWLQRCSAAVLTTGAFSSSAAFLSRRPVGISCLAAPTMPSTPFVTPSKTCSVVCFESRLSFSLLLAAGFKSREAVRDNACPDFSAPDLKEALLPRRLPLLLRLPVASSFSLPEAARAAANPR
jgi:hypothetical protein